MRIERAVAALRWVMSTPPGYLALAIVAAVVALGSALVMQYGFGLPPCDLCIEQRWGFAGAGALAAVGLLAHRVGIAHRAMVAMVGVAFLVTAGLGFRHVGVEQQWWPGPDTCTATGADAATTDELLDAIMNAPLVRCDEIPASLLGLSIAGWVVVSALAMAALGAAVLARSRGAAR